MTYRPRRLRKPRPFTVLAYTGPHYLTAEIAAVARRQFLAARRSGVVVMSGDEVTR